MTMNREEIEKAAIESCCSNKSDENINYYGKNCFIEGAEWYKKHLFHKTSVEVPQVYGEYENDNYPQIPCLVKGYLSSGYGYGIRYWNVTQQCWDDEQCDDYECAKDKVEEWAYLDDIIGGR